MLRTSSPTSSSTILKSINVADEDEFGKSNCNRTNLTNPLALIRSTKAGYLTSENTKKGNGNTKKGVKANKSSNYLTSAAKKAFYHLWHAFT